MLVQKNHLSDAFGSLFEHLSLVVVAERSVKLVHDHAWHLPSLAHQFLQLLLTEPRGRLALFRPREED